MQKHIVKKVLKIVTKEVAELCSKRNPSILRKCEKEDPEKFDLQLVCNEWRERAPRFLFLPSHFRSQQENKKFMVVSKPCSHRLYSFETEKSGDECDSIFDRYSSQVY